MFRVNYYRSWLVAGCIMALAACSGGSSGTSSGSTDSGGSSGGTTTGSVTTESLQSVNNLPDFNVDSLDAAVSTSVSAQRTRFVEDGEDDGDDSQSFSRAGCELRSCVEEFKFHLNELRGNMCVLKKMLGDQEFELDSTNYYEMSFEAGNTPGDGDQGDDFGFSARVKVSLIDETLRMGLCTNEVFVEDDDGDGEAEFTQDMAMTFAVEDGKFSGNVKNIFPSYLDSSVTDGFEIGAVLETDDPEEFAEGDTADFLGRFNSAWGAGDISLSIVKANDIIKDTVDAAFKSGTADADWGSWLSQVYGTFDANEGCAQWAAEGSFPAMTVSDAFPAEDPYVQDELAELGLSADDQFCWTEPEEGDCEDDDGCSMGDFIAAADDTGMCSFDDGNTECFSFELMEGTLNYYELPTADATYYDVVADSVLGDWEAPTIAFDADETWDCEADADGFTEIDGSSVLTALQSCFDIQGESGEGRSIESCYDKESEEDVQEEDSNVEYTDDSGSYGGGEGEGGGEEDMGGEGEPSCEDDCSLAPAELQADCLAFQEANCP